jgi:hypothetical protein
VNKAKGFALASPAYEKSKIKSIGKTNRGGARKRSVMQRFQIYHREKRGSD